MQRQKKEFFEIPSKFFKHLYAFLYSVVEVKQEKTNLLATDIWFHFQEGYSNAVRRNVRVKDFF